MDRTTAGFDQLTRFWLETAPTRGVVARLDDSLLAAFKHHNYPPVVISLLKQLVGAAILLASNLKQQAQIILQAQGDGGVPLFYVEAGDDLTFRCYANVREDAVFSDQDNLESLVAPNGNGRFALTIHPKDGQMYQGIIDMHLRNSGRQLNPKKLIAVATLLEIYLSNSQQMQTRLWLREDGDALEAMLLERLPDQNDQDNTPAWDAIISQAEATFAQAFMPFPYSEWLQFTFAGHDVRVQHSQSIRFACSCNKERVLGALKLVGELELRPLITERGLIETQCNFCGKSYEITQAQFDTLFGQHDSMRGPGSATLQ